MWSPTHIEVTILRARGLLTKGKNGTNNCFVTIGMDKEKYQTSVKDKAETNVSWEEACELKIPDQGNRAELTLTCLHRNNLGLDEFLGQVTLPLNTMDVYERPRQKWFKLESKPGKEKKSKDRGELEARISFIVKSGSLSDLSKKEKHKSSIGQLASSVGGSLLSIGQIEKRKGIKKFAKSLGSKMHLSSKKKNKDGDDGSSFNGSMASIGTPNSSNGVGGRSNRGQHAGDADPGVISEDEDEFVFDNLSHKSSASSINVSRPSFVSKQSPLMSNGGKDNSKRVLDKQADIFDPELEQIENDFSIRARTLPPPSKPPRTPYQNNGDTNADKPLDEWESKLYGNHLEVGSVNSLKRRSWENFRVPLPAPTAEDDKEAKVEKDIVEVQEAGKNIKIMQIQSSSSSSSDEDEEEEVPDVVPEVVSVDEKNPFAEVLAKFETRQDLKVAPTVAPRVHSITQNAKIHDSEPAFITEAKLKPVMLPRVLVRNREQKPEKIENFEEKQNENENNEKAIAEQKKIEKEKAVKEERIKMEEKQRELEENRIKLEEEQKRQKIEKERTLRELDEQERRENKRREEDQRLLSFAKRSISGESDVNSTTTPEQSPKERSAEKRDKRLSKFKYFGNKRDKNVADNTSSSPTSGERIIIGHEKSMTHAEKRSEISAALAKKYDGKSREELMLIANGMENEALLQRQRVKELEDYLDNLLLRVMETHPKILQNPYSRTTSAKSG